jgi:hypothetical protein
MKTLIKYYRVPYWIRTRIFLTDPDQRFHNLEFRTDTDLDRWIQLVFQIRIVSTFNWVVDPDLEKIQRKPKKEKEKKHITIINVLITVTSLMSFLKFEGSSLIKLGRPSGGFNDKHLFFIFIKFNFLFNVAFSAIKNLHQDPDHAIPYPTVTVPVCRQGIGTDQS